MKHNRFPLYILTALLAVLLSACAVQKSGSAVAELPVDKGYADGKEIYYTHTEISNSEGAERMTAIMESPVFYVPSLATVPFESLTNVYAFTNGVKGSSMTGFQPPVFDNPPGTEGYSPLRLLHMVTWADEARARELKSAAEVLAAANAGELTISNRDTVINAPIIVWDGGKR
jgi:hypothetical protein